MMPPEFSTPPRRMERGSTLFPTFRQGRIASKYQIADSRRSSSPTLILGCDTAQVSNRGFKTIIKPDIVIHIQDAIVINFTLPIGAASEIVTVQGGTPLVNTENAAVGTVIDRRFVENLPLNGRSFNTLLQLTPGVTIVPSQGTRPGQFSINGQRTNANSFQVDGVSANFGSSPAGNLAQAGGGGTQAFNAYGGTS